MDALKVAGVLIEHGEGYRDKVYLDTLGIPTWGIGRNLRDNPPRSADLAWLATQAPGAHFAKRDFDRNPANAHDLADILDPKVLGVALCRDFAVKLMLEQVQAIEADYKVNFPTWASIDIPRQAAFLDMGFNMGAAWWRGWPHTMACVATKAWGAASEAMLKSTWANQVHANEPTPGNPRGGRAWYLAQIVRTGELPNWVLGELV